MIESRRDVLLSLSADAMQSGIVKINVQPLTDRYSLDGESVWCFVDKEDYDNYNDKNFYGDIRGILLNTPVEFQEKLNIGDVVVLHCHGPLRPTLNPIWMIEELSN